MEDLGVVFIEFCVMCVVLVVLSADELWRL